MCIRDSPYMNPDSPIDRAAAKVEHDSIKADLESAGVTVIQVPPPVDCQDGVYAANWALVRGDTAVMASLPSVRQNEVPYAEKVLA